MKENCSALFSEYVIDGIRKPLTPARLLEAEVPPQEEQPSAIIDESIDPSPVLFRPDMGLRDTYAERIQSLEDHVFPLLYSSQYTRILISGALTDTLWRKGHFRLCDLTVDLGWEWNDGAVGNMAAFYASAESAAGFLDDLALKVGDISFSEAGTAGFKPVPKLLSSTCPEESDLLEELPFHTSGAMLSDETAVPRTAICDPQSWIICIPFDTCSFRLGGSALSRVVGASCGAAPQADDADYFQDCFEVIREMVEDGVILSGMSIRQGGLLPALRQYCPAPGGICADISGILRSRRESDSAEVLFGEIPGVLVQIRDTDYEYFDAQMLLQDVEYFPLGHPGSCGRVSVCDRDRNGISRILESILAAQSHEGED